MHNLQIFHGDEYYRTILVIFTPLFKLFCASEYFLDRRINANLLQSTSPIFRKLIMIRKKTMLSSQANRDSIPADARIRVIGVIRKGIRPKLLPCTRADPPARGTSQPSQWGSASYLKGLVHFDYQITNANGCRRHADGALKSNSPTLLWRGPHKFPPGGCIFTNKI